MFQKYIAFFFDIIYNNIMTSRAIAFVPDLSFYPTAKEHSYEYNQ